jgi:hypothetical protein
MAVYPHLFFVIYIFGKFKIIQINFVLIFLDNEILD